MSSSWPAISYADWAETCDTLHAHTQVLGKLAVTLAPPEPQLQHAALRLTARGWETAPLPAPDGSGTLVVVLDLRTHDVVIEASKGGVRRVPLGPDRAVGVVTRDVLAAIEDLVGSVAIDPKPQEVPWSALLTEDEEHARYDVPQVEALFQRRHVRRARSRRVPGTVSRAVNAGERLVGFVRSRREPVLGRAGHSAFG